MRLVIVPRWAGHADSDFYPWLREQLRDAFETVVTVPLAPSAQAPEIDACVAQMAGMVGDDAAHTILLGHSVGAQVVMRSLAAGVLEPVAACLLVAGWYGVDEPWDSIRPWIETPIDDARVRSCVRGPIRVLVSTNDRFTADYEVTRREFETRLWASVRVEEGCDHFNDSPQPAVLRELRALLPGSGAG